MARQPSMPEGDYQKILSDVAKQGYDTKRIVKVPQSVNAR
jgi:lipocalin